MFFLQAKYLMANRAKLFSKKRGDLGGGGESGGLEVGKKKAELSTAKRSSGDRLASPNTEKMKKKEKSRQLKQGPTLVSGMRGVPPSEGPTRGGQRRKKNSPITKGKREREQKKKKETLGNH